MWTPGLTYQAAELCVFLKEKGSRNFQLLENLDQLLSPYIIVDRKRRTVEWSRGHVTGPSLGSTTFLRVKLVAVFDLLLNSHSDKLHTWDFTLPSKPILSQVNKTLATDVQTCCYS